MPYAWKVEPGSKVKLSEFDPSFDGGMDKDKGKAMLEKLGEEISELQELLFVTGQTALLCVFQGRDTAGKDGAINRVLTYTNAQGVHTSSFKVPSEVEQRHDFLWRIHQKAPARGEIALFNRSHYEDVLVVRVHDLVPNAVWKKRFDRINAFEETLTEANTIVLKFYLHIDKDEQEERLLAREKDQTKSWKLSAGDWKERELWDQYTEAFEDMLSKCSTKHAPWLIVPANRKWFRDLAIAEAIRDALAPHRKGWMKHLEDLGQKAKSELAEYRGTPG
jgi:PPK2 family polyphosphate:nucleotide phosphotransferase